MALQSIQLQDADQRKGECSRKSVYGIRYTEEVEGFPWNLYAYPDAPCMEYLPTFIPKMIQM